jgi:hypothetical protein
MLGLMLKERLDNVEWIQLAEVLVQWERELLLSDRTRHELSSPAPTSGS